MFTLSFDRTHRVLMARINGIFSSPDMAELDGAVIHFLSLQPDSAEVRGIYDFSHVQAFAVPASKFAERGFQPPIVRGRRVLVAPAYAGESFGSSFRNLQRGAGNSAFTVVPTLQAAYALLDLTDPNFEPVEHT